MKLVLSPQLISICRTIAEKNYSADRWSEIESDDMFQTDGFIGGFDAIEQKFLFSWYPPDGQEYWFGLTIEEVGRLAAGATLEIAATRADK